ncbi:MAG: AAA family ATPase, partial [Chloroflexota bacterium]|nr:AAA family ATPase [Chloroflexota bacterium]
MFQFLELRELVFLVFPSLFAVIPLTLFAVIVHYRLWDIDILINRTLVYGTLTAGVTLVYAGGIVLLQQLFGTLTAQQSTVAIVASTLLIAALFQPLRRRLQTFVDRSFYREQVNFRQAFTDFAREVRTLIDLRDLVRVLVDRTTELLHIAHSAVFLRGPDGTFHLAEARNLPAHEATELDLDSDLLLQMQTGSVISRPEHVTFPLLVPMLAPQGGGSELIGVLALGPRLSRQRYGRDEQALLAGLADQAGTAIHVAQLIEEQRAEAERREETERRLEEHRRSPTGRAAAALAILARPEAALSELHRLTGGAGHDRDTSLLLGNLPTALANLGAESIAELAKGFNYLFTSQFAPELLPAGLRSINTQLEQVAFTPQPSIPSDGSAAPEAEPPGWAAAALVVYRLCQAALEARSIAEIIELLPPLHGREPFTGPLFCSTAPVPTADRNGQEQALVDLARYLAELQSVSDQLYTAELVDTSQDKLTYLASAVERLSRIDRRAQAELGSADRPIIQRIIENWLGIVTRAMSELQTRAHIVANLLTRYTWQTEVITLVLNVRNVGRGAARNLHVKVAAAPEYTVLDGNGALARLAPNEQAQVELRVQPRLQREANVFRAHFVVRYADSRGEGQVAHFADDIHLLRADEPFKFIPNPYVVGTPLRRGSPLFVGREDLMAFVRENLHAAHRNNLVLIGQRRTGKTSLLKQLPARLGDAYVPVYLDGQTLGLDPGLPSFFHALATEIALALQERGFSVELPELSDFAESPAHAFEHQFLRRVREAIAERHVVILLDEFEELEAAVRGGNLPPAVFGFLRHLIQHTDNLSTIFCGTHRLEELAADYWNVLFNISLYRHVGFLERPEALRLVQEPV